MVLLDSRVLIKIINRDRKKKDILYLAFENENRIVFSNSIDLDIEEEFISFRDFEYLKAKKVFVSFLDQRMLELIQQALIEKRIEKVFIYSPIAMKILFSQRLSRLRRFLASYPIYLFDRYVSEVSDSKRLYLRRYRNRILASQFFYESDRSGIDLCSNCSVHEQCLFENQKRSYSQYESDLRDKKNLCLLSFVCLSEKTKKELEESFFEKVSFLKPDRKRNRVSLFD